MNTRPQKKIIIKWENVLFIPLMILAVSGIIKSDPKIIIISILIELLFLLTFYYLIKTTRKTIQEKGLIKAVYDLITFN